MELSIPSEVPVGNRCFVLPTDNYSIDETPTLEVLLPSGTIRIPNGADPVLLEPVIHLMEVRSC